MQQKVGMIIVIIILASVMVGPHNVAAKDYSGFGLHGGLGTDVNLGLGFGLGLSYVIMGPVSVEVGPDFFFHNYQESGTTDTDWLYEEGTSLQILALRVNSLYNYDPNQAGTYFVLGSGFVSATVEYDYRERFDASSIWIDGGTSGDAGGIVFNFGLGWTFIGGFDLRLEVPVLIFFSQVGNASTIAPTITAVAGIRF